METLDLARSTRDTDEAARWRAIRTRDAAADGRFVYSVRTTGVYCRPSCPSRAARPENIAVHATCEDAEAAGFRPCKRCRPNEASLKARHATAVARACRLIEAAESLPSLAQLAQAAGLSAYHFHRVFKTVTGVTPRAYASQNRARRVESELVQAETITRAAYGAGFNASSRFYEAANARLGMTPSIYRDAGSGMTIRFATAACSLGTVLVAATEKGICAIMIGDDPKSLVQDLRHRFRKAKMVDVDAGFASTVAAVVTLVEQPKERFDLPLDISGTAFQQRVWQALRTIPIGTTRTYRDVAEAIGQPRATRAVAAACGANKIAVAIPCHRVVHSDGSLSGYRWGVERKRALIAREKP